MWPLGPIDSSPLGVPGGRPEKRWALNTGPRAGVLGARVRGDTDIHQYLKRKFHKIFLLHAVHYSIFFLILFHSLSFFKFYLFIYLWLH